MATLGGYQSVDILPNQTLYVSNLSDSIHINDLKTLVFELFIPYGHILDVVARKTKTMRGQAFIVFSEISSATAALKGVNGRTVLNKVVKVQYAKTKSYKALKPIEYYRMGKSSRFHDNLDNKDDIDRATGTEESHTLFIENMPSDMTKEAVEVLFKQYPGFKDCRFIEGRSVAFIDFATASQAEVALQGLQGFRISHSHALKISFST